MGSSRTSCRPSRGSTSRTSRRGKSWVCKATTATPELPSRTCPAGPQRCRSYLSNLQSELKQ
nr:unnamed protein product [Callosobruchus analis]